jgi:hypothetical protein
MYRFGGNAVLLEEAFVQLGLTFIHTERPEEKLLAIGRGFAAGGKHSQDAGILSEVQKVLNEIVLECLLRECSGSKFLDERHLPTECS